MPGRLRTASRPSSLSICPALYSCSVPTLVCACSVRLNLLPWVSRSLRNSDPGNKDLTRISHTFPAPKTPRRIPHYFELTISTSYLIPGNFTKTACHSPPQPMIAGASDKFALCSSHHHIPHRRAGRTGTRPESSAPPQLRLTPPSPGGRAPSTHPVLNRRKGGAQILEFPNFQRITDFIRLARWTQFPRQGAIGGEKTTGSPRNRASR